jgi:Putative MetA-pathway of phenol degradation
MSFVRSSSLFSGLLFVALPVIAAEGGALNLFNPVPDAAMREMSTDRPDTTESPYTVPAGHFQLEMSFFDYSRDGGESEAWAFGLVNIKAGLLPDTDLQLIFDTWTEERPGKTNSGFSDVTLRLKQNLWGNDGGTTALALMPYVKIPTGTDLSNGEWEGGLIVPLGIALSDRLSLGLMGEMDIVHDEEGGGHEVEWLHSVTLGIGLTDQLGLYVELVGIAGAQTEYRALFDTGFTFAVTDNLIFDTGVRIGLNDAAEDFGVFTGMSLRF